MRHLLLRTILLGSLLLGSLCVFAFGQNANNLGAKLNALPDMIGGLAASADGLTLYAGLTKDGMFTSTDDGKSWTVINNGLPSNISISALIDVNQNGIETLYVGGASGANASVYKSTDGGENWTAADNGLPNNISVSAFLSTHQNGTETLYAGTFNRVVGLQIMYKSIDGGKNWTPSGSGFSSDTNISSIVNVAQNGTETLYAGTNSGIYKSIDGGENWNLVGRSSIFEANDLVDVNQDGIETLYAGIGLYPAGAQAVVKSTDAGNNWIMTGNGLPKNSYAEDLIKVDQNGIDVLYVGTNGQGVYKSIDGGKNWIAANNGLPVSNNDFFAYDFLSVNQGNTKTLYVANMAPGKHGPYLYKSTDGGKSWTPTNAS